MSVSARESLLEDRLFDEVSYDSMQPSDEWDVVNDDCSVPEDEKTCEQIDDRPTAHDESSLPSCNEESQSFPTKESFISHQNSFVEYLSSLVPSFSVERSKVTDFGATISTATYTKGDQQKKETKAKRSGSNHSRCIIENPESIQERRDEHKQFGMNSGRGEEDCFRDQSTMSCSVEEISQISEITMDIPTVVMEQKFGQCSALPTISEAKQFDSPEIAANCAAGVRNKVKCSALTDTTMNKSEGNNDFMDFVFELVEDALCKPIKTSKSERKKVFMEAFYEESKKVVNLAKKKDSKDPLRENSKHSRSSTSTRPTTNRPRRSPSSEDKKDEAEEKSAHSMRKSDHSRMKIVDKPPLQPPGFPTPYPHDEERTMDWSKMMSLAEKQLEAEETSLVSKGSIISEGSRISDKSTFYQSVMCDDRKEIDTSATKAIAEVTSTYEAKPAIVVDESNAKSSVTSSVSNSSSTHATLADDVVKELRELSALSSSSFEEESRFLLTSTLFRFVRGLVPSFGLMTERSYEEEERAFDEVSEASILYPHENDNQTFYGEDQGLLNEEMAFKIIRYIAFVYAFVFWPQGIERRSVPNRPLHVYMKKRVDSKPASLLQLVSELDAK